MPEKNEITVIEYKPSSNTAEIYLKLIKKIYLNDRQYIYPPKKTIKFQMSYKNPFHQYGTLQFFTAYKNKRIAGFASAMINGRTAVNGIKTGYIGFYEALDDQAIADKLIDSCIDYFKKNLISRILAPVNFSTWHKYRFLTGGFDNEAFFMEPYNPAYYPDHFIRYGFKEAKKYYSHLLSDKDQFLKKYQAIKSRFVRSGYKIRKADIGRLDKELKILYELTVKIFKDNWAYTHIGFKEFLFLYSGLDKLIKEDYLLFALNPEGSHVGFLFGMPDMSAAARSMKGNNGILSKINFMLNKNKTGAFIVKTIGVLPEYHSAGAGSALLADMHEYAVKNNYGNIIHALMIEDNTSRKFARNNGGDFRQYSVFEHNI